MAAQGESTRRLVTLLWFLINLAMIGFLFTTFFVGGRIPLALCISTDPPSRNATSAPTLIPTQQPTLSPTAALPANWSYSPSTAPTTAPTVNSTIYPDDEDEFYYDDGNSGFVMMWATFLLISLSVGGTMVLKSSRTPFAVGGFAGVVFVMANLMFIMSATSAGELRRRAALGVANGADEALLGFCIIEFLLLTAFAIVLIRHKDDILEIKPGVDEIMDPRSYEPAIQGARGI